MIRLALKTTYLMIQYYRAVNTNTFGYKFNLLMLDREIVTACCEIHSKQIDTLRRKNVEVFDDTFSGTHIGHRA
jgi:hypothetical protein